MLPYVLTLASDSNVINVVIVLSLDVMDISGETQTDISHSILKSRLNEHGVVVSGQRTAELQNDIDKINEQKQQGYCGSCYGGLEPEGGCCNSCEDVRQAYVNRGWSFNNPDAIEQVRLPHVCFYTDGC
jgi:endoplasmic reticulum-Golgi intermediate compartment protein 3